MSGGPARVPLRALILEDNLADVDLMLWELRRAGYEPQYRHVDTERAYRESLSRDLDVILADYRLPQFNALEALRILQELELGVPFIVVTGSISEEAAVACMKSGATDYLLKDRLARLGPAIDQALDGRRVRTAKRSAEEEIRRRNEELSLLNGIIAASAKAADEAAFLEVVCAETARAFGAFLAAVFMLHGEDGEPRIVAEHGSTPGRSLREASLPPTWGAMSGLLRSLRGPAVINDLRNTGALAAPHAAFLERGFASMAIIPLVIDDAAVGGLGLFADQPGHFSAERDALLRAVADEVSGALARLRLEGDRLRLGAAVEQSEDAVMILRPDGIIQSVNSGFEQLFGMRRAALVGGPSKHLLADPDDERVAREIARAWEAGREWRGRLSARRPGGEAFTADISVSPIRDRSGQIVSFLVIARDITDVLQLERRYAQAQKMEAIGRLGAGVAHDFNNLLTTIMGFTDLLSERLPADTPEADDVRQIQGAVERAAGLTRQLLAFSRQQVLEPRLVSLNAIVSESGSLLRPLMGDAVELVTELDPILHMVVADSGQIGQVIMNLVMNARDALPGRGRIVVSTRNVQLDDESARELPGIKPGPGVSMKVTDNGSGIPPHVLPHIFEPFYTTKAKGKGTGLGLAIVFGIVSQSGGAIRVRSAPNTGTTFEVILPAGSAATAPSSP